MAAATKAAAAYPFGSNSEPAKAIAGAGRAKKPLDRVLHGSNLAIYVVSSTARIASVGWDSTELHLSGPRWYWPCRCCRLRAGKALGPQTLFPPPVFHGPLLGQMVKQPLFGR